jgi:hypothetical protein
MIFARSGPVTTVALLVLSRVCEGAPEGEARPAAAVQGLAAAGAVTLAPDRSRGERS